ncbi:heme/hemin ABC transporter substrate-binding protein [Leptospira sp. GIMC2001]|uniref:heme/hemin ABC transporter substrate-binding protein n=1 Tax=Leptospira sp. GIMC2001 TaxID=1513297 RepID=UPI00234BEF6F|nr:ABC transporter substrate-binding protein [Leptospira sp. GIMC2001]WCL49116.1 ABC transporter substrate-binding protein [Leptospira sp. GIMC2001]
MKEIFTKQRVIGCLVGVLIAGFCSSLLSQATSPPELRVVSLNGSLTEIIYALGRGDHLVGSDTTSMYPEKALSLPKVGYQRALSLEGIIGLKPTLVIGTEDAGPPSVIDQLSKLGIKTKILSGEPSLENCLERIKFVGNLLSAQDEAKILIDRIRNRVQKLTTNLPWKKKPVVMMVFSPARGAVLVAGKKTSASSIIELAGAENYISEYEGYKPLSAEVILQKKADIILITDHTLQSLGGREAIWKLSGLEEIKLNQRPRIVSMDDLLLLGFSSRLDVAIEELQSKIQNESSRK